MDEKKDEPVIDLIIRMDARTGEVGLYAIGAQITPDIVYQMLDLGREWIRKYELAAVMKASSLSREAGDGPETKFGP